MVQQERPVKEVADLLGHQHIDTTAVYVKVALPQLVDGGTSVPWRCSMSTFARRLVDHINRYVELRRSLGYSFESQAATLQAFGRFVKRRSEAGPLTQHLVAHLSYLNAR